MRLSGTAGETHTVGFAGATQWRAHHRPQRKRYSYQDRFEFDLSTDLRELSVSVCTFAVCFSCWMCFISSRKRSDLLGSSSIRETAGFSSWSLRSRTYAISWEPRSDPGQLKHTENQCTREPETDSLNREPCDDVIHWQSQKELRNKKSTDHQNFPDHSAAILVIFSPTR